MSQTSSFSLTPIGSIKTPFHQKFGIPRQGISLSSARGEIHFCHHINSEEACIGIDQFSHLWLLFIFSEHIHSEIKASVRPPRLGGNTKMGVFATRSSFRPNHIGMSVVKNLGFSNGILQVEGVDMLNDTPIIDIKPYVAYADKIEHSEAGYANFPPENSLTVEISPQTERKLLAANVQLPLLIEILSQDPRPAYKRNTKDDKIYKIQLDNNDISWKVVDDKAIVLDLQAK
ncbi:tRNA (N6-threonylcarbamoyladenosine(37)-N6)-methyltransferase TrmO [Glaciecola sp. 1036]|uniref:tRNA (N6-threonylcarbamoyladenosine(37)-N6)-methyltransferase TrmO n=1 Tax=Alteromonadaceae TaxID=72275 RepID=UPI003CFCE8D0